LIPLFSLDGAPIIIGVQTERFGIPRRQFSQLFIFAGVLAGVGVLLDLLALVVLRNVPLVLLMWGTGLTLAGAFALYAAMAYMRRTRRSRRTASRRAGSSAGSALSARRADQQPVMSDPEFNSKFERIVAA
jgi:phage shock protein PspC (stress-responsive transcriptional regulator)